jgi:hypothetical protein
MPGQPHAAGATGIATIALAFLCWRAIGDEPRRAVSVEPVVALRFEPGVVQGAQIGDSERWAGLVDQLGAVRRCAGSGASIELELQVGDAGTVQGARTAAPDASDRVPACLGSAVRTLRIPATLSGSQVELSVDRRRQ